jgi:nucleoside-diphosphate-sugar epimerase
MMNNVFVTGATGVPGKRVVQLLIEDGNVVNALSRSGHNDELIKNLRANPVRGDLFDPKEMTSVTSGSDVIMHLATSIPRKQIPNKPADWEMNDRIRIEGKKSLLKAAKINNIEYFIHQGVTFVYGNRDGDYVDSETPVGSRLPFIMSKGILSN